MRGLFLTYCALAALCLSSAAAVRINELSADAHAREQQPWSNGLWRVGSEAPWHAPTYNHAAWPAGQGPFGFGTNRFALNLQSNMQNKAVSLFLRIPFAVDPAIAASNATLQLIADYDDGLVAYLNGREIVRRNMGASNAFVYSDQPAHNIHTFGTQTTFAVGIASNVLTSGTNLLAIQVHNSQVDGATFGFVGSLFAAGGTTNLLLATNAQARYFIGVREPSGGLTDGDPPVYAGPTGLEWTQLSFNEAAWSLGQGPVGFGETNLATDVSANMLNVTPALYLRQSFTAAPADAADTNALEFTVGFDDGYIAFLNGTEIARSNLGSRGEFKSETAVATAAREGDTIVTVRLASASTLLSVGTNVLAIQVHNVDAADTDLVMNASLQLTGPSARTLAAATNAWRIFVGEESPSPAPDPESLIAETEFSDWVELYNDGTGAVSLAGWSLTDDAARPGQWKFPTNATIAAGGYYVVLCNNAKSNNPSSLYPQANFALAAGGEYLGLYDAASNVVSALAPAYPLQSRFHTYGVASGTASYAYFDIATPGVSNVGNMFAGVVARPEFLLPPGFHTNASVFMYIPVTSSTPNAIIRYTSDGTLPQTNSSIASGSAILLIAGTRAYRIRAFATNWIPSEDAAGTYFLNSSTIFRTNSVVSLIGDPAQTFFKSNGITAIVGGIWQTSGIWKATSEADYDFAIKRGRAFERPVHVDFIDPVRSNTASLRAGVRIAGSDFTRPRYVLQTIDSALQWTNSCEQGKPQLNLFFRPDYDGDLNYPLVASSRVDRFEGVRLRSGHNDYNNPFIRDELARRLLYDTGQVSTRGIIAGLFVNGLFRSYYNPCERMDEHFFQEWHRSTNAFDIINQGGVANGDAIAYNALQADARTRNCAILTNYLYMASKIDTANFVDYLMVNTFGATWDWPHNNFYTAHERSSNGVFRYYIWDAEGAFSNSGGKSNNYDTIGMDLQGKTNIVIGLLFTSLRASPEFRLLWADRFQKHCFQPNGCLQTNAVMARLLALRDEAEPFVQYVRSTGVNMSIFTNWIPVRRGFMSQHFDTWGMLPPVGAPEFSSWGGTVTNGYQVSLSHTNAAGQIYYALDGADPRAPGGAIAGTLYTGPITIDRSRAIKARVFDGTTNWSAAVEASFLSTQPPLVVSEIMYNPEAGGAEFIELYNAGASPIDMSGFHFDVGIVFDFAGSQVTNLGAGEYCVVVQNPALFTNRYTNAGIRIAGTYSGSLNNGGERITLAHDAFGTIASFQYADGWFPMTDGTGFSLTLRDTTVETSLLEQKVSWKASSRYGGTPGGPDAGEVPLPGAIVINEALTHTDASPDGDWIELFNTTAGAIDLTDWWLSDNELAPYKFRIPSNTVLAAGGYVVFSASNHFQHAVQGTNAFGLSELGEAVVLSSPLDAAGQPTGYREVELFGAQEREVTFGRHIKSTGKSDFVPLRAATRGTANSLPRVGPIVMTEIHYRPATNRVEFIAFYNTAATNVPLYEATTPAHTWQLSNAVAFKFPTGVVVAPHSAFVVAATSPAVFRTWYPATTNIPVYGPFTGALNNAGDRIDLLRALEPDLTNLPFGIAESVNYESVAPWPVMTVTGRSIERVAYGSYYNEALNWRLGTTTNGAPGPLYTADSDLDGVPDRWESANGLDAMNAADGSSDVDGDRMTALEEFIAGTDPNLYADRFRVSIARSATNGAPTVSLELRLPSGAGYETFDRFYAVEAAPELATNWSALLDATNLPAASTNYLHEAAPGDPANYRARVWLKSK